ncbi:MAG: hypothetical protein IKZ88_04310 [Neisseriaceae bacterium]|nr:hypothetical protein [Neisseriaceae bacterium]
MKNKLFFCAVLSLVGLTGCVQAAMDRFVAGPGDVECRNYRTQKILSQYEQRRILDNPLSYHEPAVCKNRKTGKTWTIGG